MQIEAVGGVIELSDKISLVALIVAILSFAISIISIYVQKKLNTINLDAKYYELIFNQFILDKIPNKMSLIKFVSKGKLDSSYKSLNSVMMEMVRKARYFSFVNPKFYKGLSDRTKKLDELLVDISSKTYINIIDQNKEIIRIEDAVSKIITYINKHHSQI